MRDLIVAQRRQKGASLPTIGRCCSQQGSHTIAQTPNMWDDIEQNLHMFDVLDPQNDEKARMENN